MISKDSRRKFLKTGVLAGIASCLPLDNVFAETKSEIEEIKPEEKKKAKAWHVSTYGKKNSCQMLVTKGGNLEN